LRQRVALVATLARLYVGVVLIDRECECRGHRRRIVGVVYDHMCQQQCDQRAANRVLFDHLVEAGAPCSFGQPRLPKPLNQQLRVCLSAPTHPRGYCEGGIDLKHTRRRLAGLGIASEMSESGRETVVSSRMEGVLTKGFLRCDNGLVKAMKLNKGHPHAT
jgi:hypothetical protein